MTYIYDIYKKKLVNSNNFFLHATKKPDSYRAFICMNRGVLLNFILKPLNASVGR